MIVLVQVQDPETDRWDDLHTPRKQGVAPVNGKRPPVDSVEELTMRLADNGLVGEYRIFQDNGTLTRLTITRKDQFVTTARQELPA